jgi:hypothetical protein
MGKMGGISPEPPEVLHEMSRAGGPSQQATKPQTRENFRQKRAMNAGQLSLGVE